MRRYSGDGNRGADPDRNRSDEGMRNIKQKLQKLSAWALAAAMLWSSFEVALPAKAADGENNAAILALAENSDVIQAKTTEVGGGYGTVVDGGTTGDCEWKVYDTDADGTEDLLVIGGGTYTTDYYYSESVPPWIQYNETITELVVENGVENIGDCAFESMEAIKTASLPESVSEIGLAGFMGCRLLESIVIPDNVSRIWDDTFQQCYSLESVVLPEKLRFIGSRAFYGCYQLTDIEMPTELYWIGDSAFLGCEAAKLIIPETVTNIYTYVFIGMYPQNVYNLSGVTLTREMFERDGSVGTVYTVTLKGSGDAADKTQKILPSQVAAGTRYAGTKYDASYYYSSGEGNTAWYVQNGDTYEKVTSATSFQNTPTFYYAKAFDDTTAEINASGSSEDSYTVVVKDKETDETLTEGTHYTQEITDSTDWEETDTGSLTKTVTVTVTGVAEGGYVGTMQTSFLINTQAEASVTADGNTKKYPVLEDAWKAAQGKTAVVTLLTDVEVGETLTVTDGSEITLKSEKNGDDDYTVSGNVLNNESGMIDVAAGGTFILESGNIENGVEGNNAIAVNGGTFVMNGGSAVALADGHSGVCVYSGGKAVINRGNAEGYNGLAVVNGGSATVSGGTFTGTYLAANSSAAVLLRNSDGTLQTMLEKGKAYYEVKDGKKTLITDMSGARLYGTVTVEDCTHSCESWADAGETHMGNCIVCNAEMEEEHNWNDSGKCTADGCTEQAAACVTVNGGKAVYYTTIEKAWQAAKGHSEGASVTLLTDAVVTSSLTVEDGDNIILVSDGNANYSISSGSDCYAVIWMTGGKLTMESGTVNGQGDGYTTHGIYMEGGSFTMTGGTIFGKMALYASRGTVVISDGTLSGDSSFVGYGLVSDYGDITLNGGTFSGGSDAVMAAAGKANSFLAEGYAYKQNGNWINDENASWLSGTVTVEEAPIKSVTATADKTDVKVSFDEVVTITAEVELSKDYTDSDVTYKWYRGGHLLYETKEMRYIPEWSGTQTFICEATCDGYTVTAKPVIITVREPSAEVISVEVSWDALEYTYTDGAWNPDTHSYEDGEWTADGGNSVTVKNTGNTDVTVTYQYSPTVTAVSGSFADEDGNPIDSPAALPEGEEKKAYLTLTGKPQEGFNGTLGTVTVTIGTGGGE